MGSLAPAYHASALKRQRNRRTIYTFQQRSLIDPMVEVFNGPTLDLSCERRDASTLPTQSFALFNSTFANDMALAFAARIAREQSTTAAQIRRAFQLAFSRDPDAAELAKSQAHIAAMTAWHRAHQPPAKPEPKPLIHKITSELTGESFEFVQQDDPAPYESNLQPSDVPPEIRALADFTLALINANEFVYVY
jgi:hypothetical protein